MGANRIETVSAPKIANLEIASMGIAPNGFSKALFLVHLFL
jgi:hypothetical protein